MRDHNPEPAELVHTWAEEDRALRESWLSGETPWDVVADADAAHSKALQELAAVVGWGPIMADRQASADAWLIVQHSDDRLEFQRRCLHEWEAMPTVPGWQVAFLADRIATSDGEPQQYGTQFHRDAAGDWQPWPIRSSTIDELDSIRASAGLRPFAEDYETMTGSPWPRTKPFPTGPSPSLLPDHH
jgi:hypothetical protein